MNKSEKLYFPECKIIKATIVPKSINVIFFNLKSIAKTPKHYPSHPLLDGHVEFTFGLELSETFKENKKSDYFKLFNSTINTSVSKFVGKTVSALIMFEPEEVKKLNTIGLGVPYDLISIYNDLWDAKEMQIISLAAKINSSLPHKGKVKNIKI